MRPLRRADLTAFLAALARRLRFPARIVLTGGCEAMLLGGTRPTGDVDFGVAVRGEDRWPAMEAAILAAANDAGVAVQYSTDIDRWSSVAIPPRRLKTRRLRQVGPLAVHLLDPACWAVYKLARYLDADVDDLRRVLRHERVPALALARLCGESLRASPRSTQLFAFRCHVEHFFAAHGPSIWGKRFDPARAIGVFHRAAKVAIRP
jgi:hypothetical protein